MQAQLADAYLARVAGVLPAPAPSGGRLAPVQPSRTHEPARSSAQNEPVESIRIPLSGGNLRNGHFSLRSAWHVLLADSIGGGNRDAAGRPITVAFEPGGVVETDIAGDNMILRERSAISAFFDRSGAREGDEVVLHRTGDRVSLLRTIA